MAKSKSTSKSMTTAQQLSSIIKSARQIMRKDKGLNGDLDRLPMLTWIMFLKFLDDLEQMRETEAVLEGKKFQAAIVAPYRWRDWAAIEGGITGDDLIAFINNDEAMLREMRDAAGDSGEFYTPRPVVQFMVDAIHPTLGETILDPACGTAGFLVETYNHLEKQCQTVEDREILQKSSISGGEAKPLPYLLAQMNLLLHGLEYPRIDPQNSLRFPLREIGDKQRVDIILTNPPFGGEEEKGILGNFPEDMQTAETAMLFLQLIMRKLKRPGHDSENGGRAAVVVPNGTLFGDGVAARIKEELLKNFNLHTIVRLPEGVFAPYTDIPANLLFFDRSGPTQDIWYYQIPAPEGVRLKYNVSDGLVPDPHLNNLIPKLLPSICSLN